MPQASCAGLAQGDSGSANPIFEIRNSTFTPAFSLIELLVVIAILGILIALLVPAFSSIGQANQLTSGAQILVAELNKSRQEAIARNRAVQVRFFTVPPKNEPGNTSLKGMRAIQSVVMDEMGGLGTNARFGRISHLPNGIQISPNSSLTSLVLTTNGNTNLPVFGNSDFVAFRFRPDGGTDLGTNSFWTLVTDRSTNAIPENFATVQIDPRTGRVRLFRP
jgi:uncharacterized protein (TIGR02596 family)